MSKLQEKIDLYTSEVEKLGLGLNADLRFRTFNLQSGLRKSIQFRQKRIRSN